MKKVLRVGTGEVYIFLYEDKDNIVVEDENGCVYYFSPLTETFDEIFQNEEYGSIQSSDHLH